MKYSQLFILSLMVSLVSCSSPQRKLESKIRDAEGKLYSSSNAIDTASAKEVVKLYLEYADGFPDDTLSAEMLFKAGQVENSIGQSAIALKDLERIQRYPNYKRRADAVFLQGFIAENSLFDQQKAKEYYTKFLATFPDHPLAKDVKASLNNLGKTPEELIQQFQASGQLNDSLVVK